MIENPDTLALAFDHFEERSAIREYDAGQSRDYAEREALAEAATVFSITPQSLRDHIAKSKEHDHDL